jgi:hypothetical protein
MQRVTSSLILAAAAALVGCASQAPATSAGAGTAVAPPGANAAATSAATGASPATAATATATASATPQQDKFVVPAGWRRVVKDGDERFCQTQVVTGSRLQKEETCLTKHQLEEMQDSSQQFINNVQRQGGQLSGQSGATTGGR